MLPTLALICEGPHDEAVGRTLVERILSEEGIVYNWSWYCEACGQDRTAYFWRDVPSNRELRQHRILTRLRYAEPPPHGDGPMALRAVLWLLWRSKNPGMRFILMRDRDGDRKRCEGLEWARRHHNAILVVGCAIESVEAWVLAAWKPENEKERETLEAIREELGIDPSQESHKLRRGKRSPKRIVKRLLGDADRARYAWIMKQSRISSLK